MIRPTVKRGSPLFTNLLRDRYRETDAVTLILRGLILGPLRAAEQSQTRQGDFGEHWASLVYACVTPAVTRPMSVKRIECARELRSRPAWSSSAGYRYEFTR